MVILFQTQTVAGLEGREKMEKLMIDKETMAQRLKDLRIAKGKSVAQVSEDTGIGETALRNYECGIRIPRYTAMFTLANYYGKTVDRIFFRK